MASATREVLSATLRQYTRQPLNIILLLILPPLFIVAMRSAVSTFSDVVGGNLGERGGTALSGLWAASLLTGAATFFIFRLTVRTDDRLRLAGLNLVSLASSHAVTTLVLALLTTAASVAVLGATQEIAEPGAVFAAYVLGALIYGAIGMALAWLIDGDLEGSFLLILIFMLDAFVAGPMGGGKGLFADLFPIHFASEISLGAMLGTGYEMTWFGYSAAYLAVVTVVSHIAMWWWAGR